MTKKRSSLLWSFSKQDQVSYIFGTMDVKDYRVHYFTNHVFPYIKKCDSFAAEFHLDEFANSNVQSFNLINDNQQISSLMSAKKFEKIRKPLLKSFGIDLFAFDRILPLFVINYISESVMVNSESLSLDSLLWQYASAEDKEMFGLETVEDQFRILNSIPLSYQLKFLIELSKNVSSFREKINKLIFLYENQRIDELYKASKQSLGTQKATLLYNRNANMVAKIGSIIDNKNSLFVAVGAAHLSGKFGLLRGLKQKGFVVKPINLIAQND